MDTGVGIQIKLHDGSLLGSGDVLQHEVVEPTFAEAGVQQSPRERR
jgi:hypothetical protein